MTQPSYDFSERVVVVTGAARGVGAEVVAAFAAAGAHVVTCGRHQANVEDALFMAADVRKPAEAEKVIAKAIEHFGRLDVLVNNAGGSPHVPAAEASPRFVEAIVGLNLLAPLWCRVSAHKVMAVQEDGGCIVNVASVSGMRPSPGASAYGAAKAGLINLTATLAVEWAPAVRVNCVTRRAARHRCRRRLLRWSRRHGSGWRPPCRSGAWACPEDVAGACLFLSSPAASYISGANLVIHGGGEPPPYLGAAQPG